MYKTLFSGLDDQSVIWIYGFSRTLNDDESDIVKNYLHSFIKTWKSHRSEVTGAYELLFNRFAIIATQTPGVSGCSIDSSVSIFRELRNQHGLDALDLNLIFYRDADEILSVRRVDFSHLIETQTITTETYVFDTMIKTLGVLRQGKFEAALKDSWHANLIKRVA